MAAMSRDFVLVRLTDNGLVSVPAEYRKLLGVNDGEMLVARVEDGELRLRPIRQVVADLQARVAKHADRSESGVDWLLRERRREAAREGLSSEGIPEDEHSGLERDHSIPAK